MTLSHIRQSVERARELDMLSFHWRTRLRKRKPLRIFTRTSSTPSRRNSSRHRCERHELRVEAIKAVKAIDPNIMVEQAAGITTAQQIYDFIMAGSEAAGSASGILRSPKPYELLDEMVAAARRAKEDLIKLGRL
jgi:triosephosphate isomerase